MICHAIDDDWPGECNSKATIHHYQGFYCTATPTVTEGETDGCLSILPNIDRRLGGRITNPTNILVTLEMTPKYDLTCHFCPPEFGLKVGTANIWSSRG